MSEFRTYQFYPSTEAAEPLLALLRERNIPFETSEDLGQAAFVPGIIPNTGYTRLEVKLHSGDFEWVRRLEAESSGAVLSDISPDHYLLSFTNEELYAILARPDEWSSPDVSLAGQLLRQRGHEVNTAELQAMHQQRAAQQAKAADGQPAQIAWGYGLAAFGGVLAIVIGWDLYNRKKVLPDGTHVPAFTGPVRVHGLRIMVLGGVCMLAWAFARALWRQ